MSVFREMVGREMVGFAGSPTGRDCCIAVIDDVHRAATRSRPFLRSGSARRTPVDIESGTDR